MASVVFSNKSFTAPLSFEKISYPVTVLALDYLDSLIPISLTCRYFSSNNSEFWKVFCYKFRVITTKIADSDYVFYAEYILLRKSKEVEKSISGIFLPKPLNTCIWYPCPIEYVLKIVNQPLTVLPDTILDTVISVAKGLENHVYFRCEGIGTRPVDALVSRIGALFTIFLEKGAKINEQTILNILNLKKGLRVLTVVQQLFQRRKIEIPGIFFLHTFLYCKTHEMGEYCFQQLPEVNRTLEAALKFRVRVRILRLIIEKEIGEFHKFSEVCTIILNRVIPIYSNNTMFQESNYSSYFVHIFSTLVKLGGIIKNLPESFFRINDIFLVVQIIHIILPKDLSKLEDDYLSMIIKSLNERTCSDEEMHEVSKLIEYLLKRESKITIDVLKKIEASNLLKSDKIKLIHRWNQQNLHSKTRQADIKTLIRHLPSFRDKLLSF